MWKHFVLKHFSSIKPISKKSWDGSKLLSCGCIFLKAWLARCSFSRKHGTVGDLKTRLNHKGCCLDLYFPLTTPVSHTSVGLLMSPSGPYERVNCLFRVYARSLYSRLCLHEGHAGGLVVVGVEGRHHLAADRVEDGQSGERPGDLAVLRHAPQLLGGLLDGAVVNQLDAGEGRGSGVSVSVCWCCRVRAGVNLCRPCCDALSTQRY